MKLTKKKVLVVAIAICLIATLSMGTLAWFFDTDTITNKFEVADSLTSFEIDVWEEVTGGNVIGRGEAGVNEYTYTGAAPGATFDKKVYVENTSGNNLAGQYVKVELTFTNYSVLNAMGETPATVALDCCETMLLEGDFSSDLVETQGNETAWFYAKSETKYVSTTDEITYTFYLRSVLKNSNEIDGDNINDPVLLFEGVEIPETMDINDAAYLEAKGGFQIKAVAYAIQSANIGDSSKTDLENAMDAFGTYWADPDVEPSTTDPVIPTPPVTSVTP